MVGTRLAHYQITNHIGSGGMGDVYQAADTKLKDCPLPLVLYKYKVIQQTEQRGLSPALFGSAAVNRSDLCQPGPR